ncbi:MAG: DUF554 domain-containing protein [Negativicutes bacterium]|nr:DUF554 domain-containing protein [Negativicutes bacterium]
MKGTLVNAAAVLAGSGLGLLLKKEIPARFQKTLMQGLGLAVILIGLQMAMKTQNILIVIFSLTLGALIGEALNLGAWLDRIGGWVTDRFSTAGGNAGQGFISASLVFCVGAMSIVGAIQDGLTGDATTLYAKSMLDGITSVVFASAMGAGVALSAVMVLVYQGLITFLAGWFSTIISDALVKEITAVGGILIVGIACSMLEIKKINVANLLPAIPVAAIITLLWPA